MATGRASEMARESTTSSALLTFKDRVCPSTKTLSLSLAHSPYLPPHSIFSPSLALSLCLLRFLHFIIKQFCSRTAPTTPQPHTPLRHLFLDKQKPEKVKLAAR